MIVGYKPDANPDKAKKLRETVPPFPLTENQAAKQAKKRWGKRAMAWHPAYTHRGEYRHCAVGLMVGETRDEWLVYGRGKTFEEAFHDATARGH